MSYTLPMIGGAESAQAGNFRVERSEQPLGSIRAVVVSYESGPEILHLCDAVLAQTDGAVIVDNGSAPELLEKLDGMARGSAGRMQLIRNERNLGLARAQNQGIEAVRAKGADWVLLLDDDSLPRPGMIAAFGRAFAAAAGDVAVLAPSVLQPSQAGATRYWLMRGRWRVARRPLADRIEEDALFVIASGSLVRGAALERLGGMREDFFIDYVDVEFGLRLRQAGWRILIVPDAVLEHRLGNPSRHRVALFDVKTSNHDAGRRHTIFRNRARLWRTYLQARPGWVLADVAAAAVDLFRILCFESEKREKLAGAARGLWQGLRAAPL